MCVKILTFFLTFFPIAAQAYREDGSIRELEQRFPPFPLPERKELTQSEEIVMKSVWELGENCTLSQIATQAKEHRKIWQLQTVATFLKHIEEKKYIRPYKMEDFCIMKYRYPRKIIKNTF